MEKARDEQLTKKSNSSKLSGKLKRTSDSLKTQSKNNVSLFNKIQN
jgi:hypothetical protein